ncbi:Alginate regulatory protein AlgP [Planctomycetales bacterium 10988]|nr:Alginate regulatory protein AlgP [Planctomycetales bacterium 10988]
MTVEKLQSYRKKDLAQMARSQGVKGWHAMRKDELIDVLAEEEKPTPKRTRSTKSSKKISTSSTATATKAPPKSKKSSSTAPKQTRKQAKELMEIRERRERSKNLAFGAKPDQQDNMSQDQLSLAVCDPFWLQARWNLSACGVRRAEVALAQEWHNAKPVLRLYEITSQGSTNHAGELLKTIVIHGGVKTWYLEVKDPPKTYRVEIGYLTAAGKFFMLARSNRVSTPRDGAGEVVNEQPSKEPAMTAQPKPSEVSERINRTLTAHRFLPLGINGQRERDFQFQLDAKLIVSGSTQPGSTVSLQNDCVDLRPDGSFTVTFPLEDGRQIIPAVACSPDGVEKRTIVLAVERNTKVMEPIIREHHG